jgi:hypothetical protein
MPPLWQYFALSQKSRVRPASDHVGEVRVAELHAKGVNGMPAPFLEVSGARVKRTNKGVHAAEVTSSEVQRLVVGLVDPGVRDIDASTTATVARSDRLRTPFGAF